SFGVHKAREDPGEHGRAPLAPASSWSPATLLTTLGSSAFTRSRGKGRIGVAAPNRPNFLARALGHARARSRGPRPLGRWWGGVGEELHLPGLGSRFRARLAAEKGRAESVLLETGNLGRG
ncbi:Hypothetical predicted protein, partial [Marmota monax]